MKEYERLKQLRDEHGYSVEDIAKALNMSPRRVRDWESGRINASFKEYIALAKLYNLSLDYILGLIDTPLRLE
ncbi:MAG: helix-turn-helix transcriptional regulator [Clostridia bacterium]|nr:helix-turn-helix transcriptional regulator [Clostridia bacterium]